MTFAYVFEFDICKRNEARESGADVETARLKLAHLLRVEDPFVWP